MRGCFGLAAGDVFFYATGGVGFIDAKLSGWDLNLVPPRIVNFDDFFALAAGAGTGFKVGVLISVRAEYLHYWFDKQSNLCSVTGCGPEPSVGDGDLHTLRLGANVDLEKLFGGRS